MIELLEPRIAPANLIATVVAHTLFVTGSADADSLIIDAVAGDATKFVLTPGGVGGTVNGGANFTTSTGVTDIVIKLLDGDDSLTFNNAVGGIYVKGSVFVDGGNGANALDARDLTVEKNFTIKNGKNPIGTDTTNLVNTSVLGALAIANGDGDTQTMLSRASAGSSTIRGNVSIVNGTGADETVLRDMNVGGNVTVANGHGGGSTNFFNMFNTATRSLIRGNVVVSYADGTVNSDGLWDVEVFGNVALKHGAGAATTHFDSRGTSLPPLIHGSLTITGTGTATIDVGAVGTGGGLIVERNLTISSGAGNDVFTFRNLHMGGATKLAQGGGNDTVNIDDSTFTGAFALATGKGNDGLNLERLAGTAAPTIFAAPVSVNLGTGADNFSRTGLADANLLLIVYRTFVVKYSGGYSSAFSPSRDVFPFGGRLSG